MEQSPYLQAALEAANASQEIILQYYAGNIEVELKEDETPVTVADKKAEEIIIATIQKHFPDHGFFGEESGSTNPDSPYQWIIDPIDGTSNFIRSIPLFGTQIALVHDNEIIVGVSNMPAIGELAYAEKGKGAYINGEQIHVSQTARVEESMICFGGLAYFQKREIMDRFISLALSTRRQRGIGDCYMYHLLASGRCDTVVEAYISYWDIAAAACILQEAGGTMTQIDGSPLSRETKTCIATNGILHERIVSQFQ